MQYLVAIYRLGLLAFAGRSYVLSPITIGDLPATQAVQVVFTSTVNSFTNAIDDAAHPDDYRSPLPSETRTYELQSIPTMDGYTPSGASGRFQFGDRLP